MNELTRAKFLSDDELLNLKVTLERLKQKEPRNTTLLETLLATGVRCSEVLAITSADLLLNDKSVYIRGLKGSRDREIPLRPELFSRLLELAPEVGRIFPIKSARLRQIWSLYRPCSKGLHSIRHRAALDLYQRTRDIKLVQTFLGHRNMMNTEIYLNFVSSKEDLRRALLGEIA